MALGLLAPWLVMGCGSDSEAPSPPGTSGSTDAGTNTGADPQFIEDMLAEHNAVRAAATPQPSPALPALTWDAAAEKTAASWVARCKFEHNPNRGNAGENIAAATPGSWQTRDVVKNWAAEAKDYDYAHNTCTSGKECGHYTQVVWRNTTRVGCATKVCTENSPFGAQFPTWQFWVCDYTPPGNYVGQRPY
jgi:uncharacterized protein YkwD